jgi:ABC-type histidine transport system ATPase subunit
VYDERLRDADRTNAQIREARARAQLKKQLNAQQAQVDALTTHLREIDERKANAIAEASMPIDGLAFDDTGVTYGGVPLKQCSAAEQLRVSIAMAMALNPTVRVIRITDGSLLDSSNMALIAEMAAERDFQVWIERVDESGRVGVLIEDGQVVGHLAEAVRA